MMPLTAGSAPYEHETFTHWRGSPFLLARLPLFARLARLIQFGRIARSLDLGDVPDQPVWLTTLIDKLRQRQATYQAAL